MNDFLIILRDNWALLLVGQYPNGPLGGLAITLVLSFLGLILAFPLGVLLALARVSPIRWLRAPATAVVYVVRGVPLIMFIFWVYFFLPALIGFNVGVELGQLAIVGVFLPIAWLLRHTRFYRWVIVAGGSAAIVVLGLFWTLDRIGWLA